MILTDVTPQMGLPHADVLAPLLSLIPVASIDDALRANAQCPFALGAAVFGEPRAAGKLARQIDAGCVVINDLIAPTADPRVPLAGRRQSGFGVTRGAAGSGGNDAAESHHSPPWQLACSSGRTDTLGRPVAGRFSGRRSRLRLANTAGPRLVGRANGDAQSSENGTNKKTVDTTRTKNQEPQNQEPRTKNQEPRTKNQEPRTKNKTKNNQEPRTKNQEPRTKNQEPRTKNQEPRTKNQEPRTKKSQPSREGSRCQVNERLPLWVEAWGDWPRPARWPPAAMP